MRRTANQDGQATVELVAVLPALAVLAVAAWWLVAGAATWLQAGGAARAGARAAVVGEDPVVRVQGFAPAAVVRADPARPGRVRVELTAPPLPWVGRVRIGAAAEAVAR